MSFSQLPPEVMMQIFSNLWWYDVPNKVRLQRVNKKWRHCIRRPESWTRDTDLRISFYQNSRYKSSYFEANIAQLEYAPQITSVRLSGSDDEPEQDLLESLFKTLWKNSHKLRLTRLELLGLCGHEDYEVGCKEEYLELCLRLIAPSPDTIKHIRMYCCEVDDCKLREGFGQVLHACPALERLEWTNAPYSSQETTANALRDLPIRQLLLGFEKGGGSAPAMVLNAAENSSIRVLEVPDCCGFEFQTFLHFLSPEAAAPIQVLKIDCNIHDLFDFLPAFPTVFPNLAMVEASYMYNMEFWYRFEISKARPMKIAMAIGDFMQNSRDRDLPLTLNLNIVGKKMSFSEQLWSALNLIRGSESGTKRGKEAKKWNRTLGDDEVKVCIQSVTRSW